MEAVALWAFWVFVLYEAMVVMRMLGLTYHAHAWSSSGSAAGPGGRPRGSTGGSTANS